MNRNTIHETARFQCAELAAFLVNSNRDAMKASGEPEGTSSRHAAYDACELMEISTALHHWEERQCNENMDEKTETRGVRRAGQLTMRAQGIAEKYGLFARRGSGDPRGCALYLLTDYQQQEAYGKSFYSANSTAWYAIPRNR